MEGIFQAAKGVYWVQGFDEFKTLIKKNLVVITRYSIYIPFKDGVLVYGSLDPKVYPKLKRLSDGKTASNCHTPSMKKIKDCPPDTQFYLGYPKQWDEVKDVRKFYLYEDVGDAQGESRSSEFDDPILFKSKYSATTKTFDIGYFDVEDYADFKVSIKDKNHLFFKYIEIDGAELLVYFIHLDDEGWSIPSWSSKRKRTVKIVWMKGQDGKWKQNEKYESIIYDWDDGDWESV